MGLSVLECFITDRNSIIYPTVKGNDYIRPITPQNVILDEVGIHSFESMEVGGIMACIDHHSDTIGK